MAASEGEYLRLQSRSDVTILVVNFCTRIRDKPENGVADKLLSVVRAVANRFEVPVKRMDAMEGVFSIESILSVADMIANLEFPSGSRVVPVLMLDNNNRSVIAGGEHTQSNTLRPVYSALETIAPGCIAMLWCYDSNSEHKTLAWRSRRCQDIFETQVESDGLDGDRGLLLSLWNEVTACQCRAFASLVFPSIRLTDGMLMIGPLPTASTEPWEMVFCAVTPGEASSDESECSDGESDPLVSDSLANHARSRIRSDMFTCRIRRPSSEEGDSNEEEKLMRNVAVHLIHSGEKYNAEFSAQLHHFKDKCIPAVQGVEVVEVGEWHVYPSTEEEARNRCRASPGKAAHVAVVLDSADLLYSNDTTKLTELLQSLSAYDKLVLCLAFDVGFLTMTGTIDVLRSQKMAARLQEMQRVGIDIDGDSSGDDSGSQAAQRRRKIVVLSWWTKASKGVAEELKNIIVEASEEASEKGSEEASDTPIDVSKPPKGWFELAVAQWNEYSAWSKACWLLGVATASASFVYLSRSAMKTVLGSPYGS